MTSPSDTSERAFSRPFSVDDLDPSIIYPAHAGMTLRDYFAAQALTGAQVWDAVLNGKNAVLAGGGAGKLAEIAYAVADAMLKARDGKADQPEDPCPGCRPGVVCRTPSCGRLKARDGTQ